MRIRALRATAAGLSLALLLSACAGGSSTDIVDAALSDVSSSNGLSLAPATTEPIDDPPAETSSTESAVPAEDVSTEETTTEETTTEETETAGAIAAEPVEEAAPEEPATDAAPPPATSLPAATVEPTALPEPTTVPAVAEVAVQLPNVDVVDLATGQTANLANFSKPGPTLVWFWAPH